MGTPHKILRYLRIRRGGTPRIPIEVMLSDAQTRVGTPHKLLEQLGWKHRTTLKAQIQEPGGWVGSRFLKMDFRSQFGSQQSSESKLELSVTIFKIVELMEFNLRYFIH